MALAAIFLGIVGVLLYYGIMNGFMDILFDLVTGPLVGHVQIHVPGWRDERAIDLFIEDAAHVLAAIRRYETVHQAAPRNFAPVLAAVKEDAFTAVVVGIDEAAESGHSGLLGSAGSGQIGNHRILVGQGLAARLGIEVGHEMAIIGQAADGSIANDLYTVAGIISSNVEIVNRNGMVMSLTDSQELLMMPGSVHEIVIRLRRSDDVPVLLEQMAADPLLADMEAVSWDQVMPDIATALEFSYIFSLIILVLMLVAAAAGIANTMMMATFERTHEFGMLMALGCSPKKIVSLILCEAAILGMVGAVVGAVLGLGLVCYAGTTGIDFAAMGGEAARDISSQGMIIPMIVYPRLNPSDIIICTLAVLLTSILATIWPAIHAVSLEPVEAMRS
jgi:ABC-type lipoprotein release transport system permease subunit